VSSFARKVAVNTSLYAIGRVVVSAVGVVATAMVTRYLGPDRFGALTVAVVYVSIVSLFCDLGLYVVTIRELARRPDEQPRLLANTLALGILLSVVAFAVTLGLMLVLYPGADRHLVREAIVLLALPVLASGVSGTAYAYLISTQRAGPAALAGIASSAALVGALTLAVALHASFLIVVGAYVLQGLVGHAVPVAFAGRALPRRPGFDMALWRRLAAAAVPQAAVLVLTSAYFRIDTVLLSVLASDRQVALYGVAYRVVEGLILLPVVFMLALFPELARHDKGSARLTELVQHAFSTVVVGVVPIVVIVVAFSREIVRVVAGPAYGPAATVLAILMAAVALNYLVTVFYQTLVAVGEQSRLAGTMLVVLVVNVVANAVLIPADGARGAAYALILSELASLVLVVRLITRVASRPRIDRLARVALATAAAAGAGFGLGATSFASSGPALAVLAAGAAVVIAVYGVALLLLRAVPSGLEMITAPIERRLGMRPATSDRGS
jgi:O-antigen/teichoic acid export membrane protein